MSQNEKIESGVLLIARDVMKDATLLPADDLFERGLDSLRAAAILAAVQSEYSVEVDLGALFANPCVTGITEEVSKLLPAER